MDPWTTIQLLSETTKRLEKESILRSIPDSSDFWEGTKLALDPMVTFGIQKLPKQPSEGNGAPFSQFRRLCRDLSTRKLTGNAAKAAVEKFASMCTAAQWEMWYSRILERNLDCGVQRRTLSKFGPVQHRVQVFECQLADSMDDAKSLPTNAFVEAKYDGVRTLWFITRKDSEDDLFVSELSYEARALSRNGKEFHNFGEIGAQLAMLGKDPGFPECGIVVDGEVISDGNFNKLMTQVQRKSDVDFSGYLMAFDIMTVDDFLKQRKTPPLKRRREVLEAALDGLTKTVMAAGLKPLVIPSVVEKGVNAETEQDRIMDLFTLHTQAGFEGLIVKDAEAEYKFDRTRDWLKVKPTETWDLTIIRSVEGDGRLRGKLGAWWCEGEDSKGRKIAVRVGGGISDADRDEYWRNRADGRIIEVLGDALSKNKDGDTYSIRFPRWTERFRDHMGEKA